jgi:hypothetical protein
LVAVIDRAASAKSSFSNVGAIEPQRRQYRMLHGMRGRAAHREARVESAMKFAMKLLSRNMFALGRADVVVLSSPPKFQIWQGAEYPAETVKYFGGRRDFNLEWQRHGAGGQKSARATEAS